MSLATSTMSAGGGGAAGGGLAMAHHAGAVGTAAPPPQQHASTNASAAGGMGPPPLVVAGDISNKQQTASLKQVKQVAHLPLVGMDLHAAEPVLSYFPPKTDDPSKGASPVLVGKMKPDLALRGANETAHKTLRKYLAHSKPFGALRTDTLADHHHPQKDSSNEVILPKPHHWLGLRRLADAPDFLQPATAATAKTTSTTAHAIDQDELADAACGAVLINSTLDGSSAPAGDDFDRVVYKVRLHQSKKALTVLPEEAVQCLLHQAQYHVSHKYKQQQQQPPQVASKKKPTKSNNKTATEDTESHSEEDIVNYPVAVALPAWAFHDAAIEALLEATEQTGVVLHRPLCALAGSLILPVGGQAPALLQRLVQVRKALQQEFQKTVLTENPDAIWEDAVLFILIGATADEGLECTAVQVSSENMQNAAALFGEYHVLSNVSYQSKDPIKSLLHKCATELEAAVELQAPEADGPAGIVFYGTAAQQEALKTAWNNKDAAAVPTEWKDVPVLTSKPEAVALGAAVLGGISHGRATRLRAASAGSKKLKAELAIQIQHVAPVAVGVRFNYHGSDDKNNDKWLPVKTLFDFDRRVPAGPYTMDLTAAECAVHRADSTAAETLSDEQLLQAVKDQQGSKQIPVRERAALDLRVQVVQKWTRDGDWKPVGDVMKPLVKNDGVEDDEEEDDDADKKKESKEEACESVALELSLGITGMITTTLTGDRQSVVQATHSARNSAIRYYVGIGLAILFFGGFMVRSYREEYVFKRDVKRLLTYYKHTIPGSMADGDEHNAMYLVYKYRHKKDRLWKMLEKKYGEPVLQTYEYPDIIDDDDENSSPQQEKHQEETVDLDEDKDEPPPPDDEEEAEAEDEEEEEEEDDEEEEEDDEEAGSDEL